MKILIVDDNEDSRIILKKTLESEGHTVKEASNGAEALKTAKESPPDMIISDILMPVMDGFRLCREIKQDKQASKIPFVFYTATYVDPRDEKLSMSLGASRLTRLQGLPTGVLWTSCSKGALQGQRGSKANFQRLCWI